MPDWYEIDFLAVEAAKSGDAIGIRCSVNNIASIHIVDGGFQETGEQLVRHIRAHYGNPRHIDTVLLTHPDGDHARGLEAVLESFSVGQLWMLRPWSYARELLPRFPRFRTVEGLVGRLQEIYSNVDLLERVAARRGIPILEPFRGNRIGPFVVLSPSRETYLDLIVDSDRTPESIAPLIPFGRQPVGGLLGAFGQAIRFVRSAWGAEVFSDQETSAENEMSVVQYAEIAGKRILLTGDAGRRALSEAAEVAGWLGIRLPGIDVFQVPHHGSRRNVSTVVLDQWLGPRLPLPSPNPAFCGYVSSAKADEDHPRKAVIRAVYHRGGRVVATEGRSIRTQHQAPARAGWVAVNPEVYPEDQES